MIKILIVLIGGGLGAVCRYAASLMAVKYFGPRLPVGTLFVNLTGCFLIGISFELAERTSLITPSMRLFFMTGFLGGLTTFSTYALETVIAKHRGMNLIAVANFIANNIAGMLMVLAGIWLVNVVFNWKS